MLHRALAYSLFTVACGFGLGALAQTKPAAAQVKPATSAPAAPAAAPQPPAKPPEPVSSLPQATTASFGDWVLRCRRPDGGPDLATTCEVAQTLQVQGQGPIAEIAFGRPPAKDGGKEAMRLVVVVPNNVTFPGVVTMSIDDKDARPVELTYRRCLPAGCFADAEASNDVLARWRPQGERGRIMFKDGASRDVALPFSFRGLSQALDAMAKL